MAEHAEIARRHRDAPGGVDEVTVLECNQQVAFSVEHSYPAEARAVVFVVLAGQEYGTGSSRDWAAKGTALLGVRAVVAQSFERIHRSNLVGMGVLPLQFAEGTSAATLKLDGTERYEIAGLDAQLKPQQMLTLRATRVSGQVVEAPVRCRIDTPIEIDYYLHGGILPYVLRQLLGTA